MYHSRPQSRPRSARTPALAPMPPLVPSLPPAVHPALWPTLLRPLALPPNAHRVLFGPEWTAQWKICTLKLRLLKRPFKLLVPKPAADLAYTHAARAVQATKNPPSPTNGCVRSAGQIAPP
jgi:hypothetical protein